MVSKKKWSDLHFLSMHQYMLKLLLLLSKSSQHSVLKIISDAHSDILNYLIYECSDPIFFICRKIIKSFRNITY